LKKKKIRGHNRRQKQIEQWRSENLLLDLNDLEERERDYVKIRIEPWCNISVTNSIIPSPSRKTKRLILNGLLDIYEAWKTVLDKSGQRYYLKIWLFEPHFTKSQVVCAIGESLHFYDNVFFDPGDGKKLSVSNYDAQLKDRLSKFCWKSYLDEEDIEDNVVGDQAGYGDINDYYRTVTWFNRKLKKPHRKVTLAEKIGETEVIYFFKRGDVWVGESTK